MLAQPFFLDLPCHAQTPDRFAVTAAVKWTGGGGLHFSFRFCGDVRLLRWPASVPAARRDGLWRHTCCEAFVAESGSPVYREFNFSPSGEWAAYHFSTYRQAFPAALQVDAAPPSIAQECEITGGRLDAVLAADWLPAAEAGFDIGLTVVLESADGTLSYRALRHLGPQPDFHRRESFALFLPRTT